MMFPIAIGAQRSAKKDSLLIDKIKTYLSRKFIYKGIFDRVRVMVEQGQPARVLECRSGISKISILEAFQRREFELPSASFEARAEAFLQAGRRAGRRPLIIDAGANVGVTALYFKLRYPDATIVAIEPQDENFALLQKNLDGLDGVHCLKAALHSSADQGLAIVQPAGLGNDAYRMQGTAPSAGNARDDARVVGTITTCTVAGIVGQFPGCFPFVLKVDIEGHEKEVFGGDTASINRFPVIFLEPHDWMLPGEQTSRTFAAFSAQFPRDLAISGDKLVSLQI
ncbi:FkbM family methyltransferase [Methylobacterium radiodurans]|uniref:Methyltransferase FkbM domain-containing protein n=1 Tax=Methylobacterium radiodurans TaxID=2202828 RepID=A0A2U8VPP8_9HYPH|nr:FkbM family methyltransferase [Methylobacterium radiodurans]AWN35458.1 hypothetical protein DK427_06705 [Methylobacterium radiodurans]